MRRPASVCRGCPNRRDAISSLDDLAALQAFQRIFAQMTIQREKLYPAFVRFVLKDNRRTVIKRCIVVGETVYHSVKWSEDRRTRPHKQVDPDVDRASLAVARLKNIARIQQAGFVVAADAHPDSRRFHSAEDLCGERVGICELIRIAEL